MDGKIGCGKETHSFFPFLNELKEAPGVKDYFSFV
jgi:hypothetical protein